ncbi:MAG TPA: flagellar motor protein MotA [Alphaproteobacteria bacterium]|nr:flagellar motor protein MotA [Alphaproteobacteria bacterium]
MTRLRRFLVRMILFLLAVAAVVALLLPQLERVFLHNVPLNSMILGAALIGIVFIFRMVLQLKPELAWIESYKRSRQPLARTTPRLLAPMATMLGERKDKQLSLSTTSMRTLLDGISSRLDEARDISRYLIGLMIFLGLLGTFWGLLDTVSSVGTVIQSLEIGSNDVASIFNNLKSGLERPLAGMGTSFSSSLFGLASSLVLGFLDLQAGQAQNLFYNDLEEWLSSLTRLSGGGIIAEGETSVPAYIEALLEKTADSLDALQRTVQRGEDNRTATSTHLFTLSERLSTLTDQMRAEQSLLVKLVEGQMEMRPVLAKLAESAGERGIDEASRIHIRNMDLYLARLVEELSVGRQTTVDELRAEIRLLARTIANLAEEAGP